MRLLKQDRFTRSKFYEEKAQLGKIVFLALPGKVAIPSFQSNAPNGSSPSSPVFLAKGDFIPPVLRLLKFFISGSLTTGVQISAESTDGVFLNSLKLSSVLMTGKEEGLVSGKGFDLMTKFSMRKEVQ